MNELTSVAIDPRGTAYVVWGDHRDGYVASSDDGGRTWSTPTNFNTPPLGAVIHPTVAANRPGEVEVAWYGTSVYGDANDGQVMGQPLSPSGAAWYVYWARSTDAGHSFGIPLRETPLVHRGRICTQGLLCLPDNSRNLADDFGMVIDPATGLTTIAYTTDDGYLTANDAYTAVAAQVQH